MSTIEVSIVTPMYNARTWLPGLLETTRRQTFQDFEHLLIDDCSSDGSADEATKLCADDARVKVLRMAQNGGPAAARNMGIAAAQARYLAFLDADDLWLPQKLAQQVAWMKRHGHAFTYHDYRHMSPDGMKCGAVVSGPDVLTLEALHTRRGTGCLSVMVDAQKLPWFRFPELHRSLPEDFLAWVAILQRGHHGHRLPVDLARYRLTPASRSSNKLTAALAVWRLYREVEKLPLQTALSWWLQYVWNARQLYKRSKPI